MNRHRRFGAMKVTRTLALSALWGLWASASACADKGAGTEGNWSATSAPASMATVAALGTPVANVPKASPSTGTSPTLTTFVQTWTTKSREDQDQWFAVMRRQVGALTGQPGFVSLSVHRGDDGKHIAVYAQWRSTEDFLSARASPAAKAGHDELVKWGSPEGGSTYTVSDVFGPSNGDDGGKPEAQGTLVLDAKRRWAARQFETREVRVNGVSLHVAEGGQGDPIFVLHGYPQSGEVWRSVAPELAKMHRVIIPDLRGMGLSEAPAGDYDLGTVAEDLHQLAASMGIAKVKVVGHDWGGAAGAVYALRYRDEVSKLAFLESALAGAGFETLWNFSAPNDGLTFIPFLLMGGSDPVGDTTAALAQGREGVFLRHLWSSFTGDKEAAPFAAWAPYVEAMSRPGVFVSSSSYYRSVYTSAQQVKKLLVRKLGIPVLAMAGEKGIGKKHEALVRAFAANIQNNLVLSGAGHFLPEERPKEVAHALNEFFAE